MKGAVFADAGSLWDYQRATTYPGRAAGETHRSPDDSNAIRSSVGVGLIWDSPFGPLRFDYAIPLTKEDYDRVQAVPLQRRHAVLIAALRHAAAALVA